MDIVARVAFPEWLANVILARWTTRSPDLSRVVEEWTAFPRPVDAIAEIAVPLLGESDWLPTGTATVSAGVLRYLRQAADDPRIVSAIEGSRYCNRLAEPRGGLPVKGLRPRALMILLGLASTSAIVQAVGTATPPQVTAAVTRAMDERKAALRAL